MEISTTHSRRVKSSFIALAATAATAAAFGSSGASAAKFATAAKATVKVPAGAVAQSGRIRYCSDISSPPLEFYKNGTQATGSDVELGNALASVMGLKPEWVNTAFSGIIPALQAGHCDAIMSQLFIKPAREKVVNFVHYMNSSEAVLVAAGNPKHISGISGLCGDTVAAETGTTITDFLATQSKKCKAAGKSPISVQTFLRDSDALEQLGLGHVDAYGTTLETGAYDISQSGHKFKFAGKPFGKIPTGIATNKKNTALRTAIAKAFAVARRNGTYKRIFDKWGLTGDLVR